MAICYVAHKYGGDPANLERAKKITHDLQMENPTHCFICPLLTFSHMKYGELDFEDEMELCKDIVRRAEAYKSRLTLPVWWVWR